MRPRYVLKMLLLGVLTLPISFEAVAQLPEGWESLTAEEFGISAEPLLKKKANTPKSVKEAIQLRAAELVLEEGVTERLTYDQLLALVRVAKKELSTSELSSIVDSVTQRGDVTTLSYLQLLERCQLLNTERDKLKRVENRHNVCQDVATWIDTQEDLTSLSTHELTKLLYKLGMHDWYVRHFEVIWTGEIVPPRTGEYRFSGSTANPNFNDSLGYYHQSMQVKVGDQQVLSQGADNWDAQGEAVTLAEGVAVPLEVRFKFEVSKEETKTPGRPIQMERSPSAVLKWTGPGITIQVVPSSAFSGGLQAKYFNHSRNGTAEGEPRTDIFTCTEPNIDHAWVGGRNFYCAYPNARDRVREELFSRVMTAEAWEAATELAVVQQDASKHIDSHPLIKRSDLSSYLTRSQRREFLQKLTTQTEILKQLTTDRAYAIYTQYWHGAEDEAFDFLSAWLNEHPVPETKLADSVDDYFWKNRWPYRRMTIATLLQMPEHGERMEASCVEREDGSCSLAAAYTCAYGSLQEGEIQTWIDQLDERLEDESLTGDRRVGWLMARSMAEEIRYTPPSPFMIKRERIMAGQGWLDEAMLVAESQAVKDQIVLEKIARLSAMNKWEKAHELQSEYSAPNDFTSTLQLLKNKQAERLEEEQIEAEKSLREELRRREEQAAQRAAN